MTKYEEERQKYLKSRSDTICLTRGEVETILQILRELTGKQRRINCMEQYKRFMREKKKCIRTERVFTVEGIEIAIYKN